MKPKFWKTTIEIVTDYDPHKLELEDLAREATYGDAYCIGCTHEPMKEEDLEEGLREFFGLNEEDEE